MNSNPSAAEDRKQSWRMLGAGLLLIGFGMFGLLAGYKFSSADQTGRVDKLRNQVVDQGSEILTNRARIAQLEGELQARNIPIPPAATTTTTRAPVTTTPSQPARPATPPSTPPAPPTTTTTTAPPRCTAQVAGLCIGGTP